MSKKPRGKHAKTEARPQPAQMRAIDRLIEREDIEGAKERLEPLIGSYPDYPPLLERYVEVLQELGETWRAGAVAQQWAEAHPRIVAAWEYALDCHLHNRLPLLAHEAAEQLHSLGEKVPAGILELDLSKVQDKGPFGQVERDTLRRHELGLLWMNSGHFQRIVEELADEGFPPIRNNYATALFHLGRVREALEAFSKLWSEAPSNLYALQWVIQLRLFLGDDMGASGLAAPLRHTLPQRSEDATAQLSGLLLLSEDQAVLEAYKRIEGLKWYTEEHFDPARIHHRAAVAAARLGDKKCARSLWEKALGASPDFELAEENLDNLDLPEQAARNPWAWPLQQWFPQTFLQELRRIGGMRDSKAAERRLVESADSLGIHNSYLGLICRQGDKAAHGLAQLILRGRLQRGDPSALGELKALLTQRAGTDESRHSLAQALIEEGHLPANQPVPLLIKGEVREIRLFSCSIDGEPRPSGLPRAAMSKMGEALDGIWAGKHQAAVEMLTSLLEQFPRHPVLLCNLSAAYLGLKQNDKAEALLREALEIKPDYLIARCALANIHLQRNEIEAAEQLLRGLVEREHLHISEVCNLFSTLTLVHKAKGEDEAVKACLHMLESLVDEYPGPVEQHLARLYAQLEHFPRSSWLQRLFRSFTRRGR